MVSGGEPLLRKDIPEILRFIKSCGLQVSLNTNGLLLGRRFQELEGAFDFIVISIDSADPAGYERIRGVNGLNKVLSTVRELKTGGKNVNIQFRCTVSRQNLNSFPDIIELATEYGVSGVGFNPIDFNSESFGRGSFDSSSNKELLVPTLEELHEFSQALNGELGLKIGNWFSTGVITWNVDNFLRLHDYFLLIRRSEALKTDKFPCFWPFTAALVDYDGSVRPCFYTDAFSNISVITPEDFSSPKKILQVYEQNRCHSCRAHIFT